VATGLVAEPGPEDLDRLAAADPRRGDVVPQIVGRRCPPSWQRSARHGGVLVPMPRPKVGGQQQSGLVWPNSAR
jgi:hypothetical protein